GVGGGVTGDGGVPGGGVTPGEVPGVPGVVGGTPGSGVVVVVLALGVGSWFAPPPLVPQAAIRAVTAPPSATTIDFLMILLRALVRTCDASHHDRRCAKRSDV